MRMLYFVIPYISLATTLLFSLRAFEFEGDPDKNVVLEKDSFRSYGETIIDLYKYRLNPRRTRFDFSQKPNGLAIPEKTFYLSKRLAKGCKCQSSEKLVILGENFYPKNVTTRVCLKTGCCNDAKTECQEVRYTVRVLRTREAEDEVQRDLHPLLSLHWRSESLEVVVACVCLMRATFI